MTLYGISESGTTVTVNTTVSSGLTANEPVTISGTSASGYNGNWVVVSAAGASFTFTDRRRAWALAAAERIQTPAASPFR